MRLHDWYLSCIVIHKTWEKGANQMNHFWSEITEHFQSALQKAETLGKEDLKTLSDIPEIQSYLKELSEEDMLRLIDHARKIKERKDSDLKPIDHTTFTRNQTMKTEDQKMYNHVQAGIRLAFPRQVIETLKKLEVPTLIYPGYGRLVLGLPDRK
jgi:formate dehydrogenase maturation protein FdhE